MNFIFEIPIRVTIEPIGGKQYAYPEAKLIQRIIRDKIRKAMNQHSTIRLWSIDLPNEVQPPRVFGGE